MPDSNTRLQQLLHAAATDGTLQSVVFSRPRSREQPQIRVNVRPIVLQDRPHFQFASRTKTQEFHRNLPPDEAAVELARLAEHDFRDVRLVTESCIWEGRYSQKGHCSLKRRPVDVTAQVKSTTSRVSSSTAHPAAGGITERTPEQQLPVVESHNRSRAYLIPEGIPCPFLVHTGVMAADGKVRARQFHKFRQINRYLEFIHNVVDRLPADEVIQVVDFGCGKSYLTFAVQYLLTQVCGRRCRITGLDRREDVVATCRRITAELGLDGLTFEVGQIANFTPAGRVHLAISLHACDTATDDALMQAVMWNCDVIMAVPCCQHELASRLPRTAVPLMTTHGILKERFAALATDAMRAAALNAMGYDARVMEFIDMEHTAKNLLIRAVRLRDESLPTDQTSGRITSPVFVDPSATDDGVTGKTTGRRDLDTRARQYVGQLRQFREELGTPPLRFEKLLIEAGWLPAAISS